MITDTYQLESFSENIQSHVLLVLFYIPTNQPTNQLLLTHYSIFFNRKTTQERCIIITRYFHPARASGRRRASLRTTRKKRSKSSTWMIWTTWTSLHLEPCSRAWFRNRYRTRSMSKSRPSATSLRIHEVRFLWNSEAVGNEILLFLRSTPVVLPSRTAYHSSGYVFKSDANLFHYFFLLFEIQIVQSM